MEQKYNIKLSKSEIHYTLAGLDKYLSYAKNILKEYDIEPWRKEVRNIRKLKKRIKTRLNKINHEEAKVFCPFDPSVKCNNEHLCYSCEIR